ncbi:MAG: T9SS type A sorting domain-containing protein [Candidatus Edwardsbacteria bacterium]|nr:T9SS type A sorting domain-containing protein [Candidatus Edwardsbacteria bacterium]
MLFAVRAPGQTFFVDNFETDKGWAFGGSANQSWARGTPAGGAATGSDPIGAHAGSYCLGTNMAGSYASSESSYARSPSFSCAGYSQVYLHFYRWLGTKGSSNTACSVQVSTDGAAWTGIWGNPNPALDDGAWANISHDISAVAANQATVYVRFRLKDSGANPPRYTGWNIDNLLVDTSSVRTLAVSLSQFNCQADDDGVTLTWRTESERDCYRWEIERSTAQDGMYRPVGTVAGHGTTCDPHGYRYEDRSLPGKGIYFYRLAEIDLSGDTTHHGPITVAYDGQGIAEFLVEPAYPNPAHGQASIGYQLPLPGRVSLGVYDVMGRRVMILYDGDRPSGRFTANWDGRDADGRRVASGVYLYRVEYQDELGDGGRRVAVKRLAMIR